jgi:hypothetical protein
MKFDPSRWLGEREKGVTIGPYENVYATVSPSLSLD